MTRLADARAPRLVAVGLVGLFGLALGLAGCGGDGAPKPQGGVPRPVLQGIAPTRLALGDTLTIMGENFGAEAAGERTRVVIEGSYSTPSGRIPVRVELASVQAVNPGTLSWVVGPNMPFGQLQDIGVLEGTMQAANVGADGQSSPVSERIPIKLEVAPSIVIRRLQPLNAGCGQPVTDTTAMTPLALEVEAIGLGAGTTQGGVIFSYTMFKENFRFDGFFGTDFQTDPALLFPQRGAVTILDYVPSGTVSAIGTGTPRELTVIQQGLGETGIGSGNRLFDQLLVYAGQAGQSVGLDRKFRLSQIRTAPLPNEQAQSYQATILVTAVDRSGRVARRSIPVRVWAPVSIEEDGSARPVRFYLPTLIRSCIRGTSPPATMKYSEDSSETRARSLEVVGSLGSSLDPKLLAKLDASFRVEVDEQASSTTLTGTSLDVAVLPGEFGAVYRQLVQLERVATVRQRDACGVEQELGRAILTDWQWNPELAKARSNSCPPVPPSGLKEYLAPGTPGR